MNSHQILDSLIARTKAAALAGKGNATLTVSYGAVVLMCRVIHGRAYLSTRLHNRISKAALLEWMEANVPDPVREEVDNAIAQSIVDAERYVVDGAETLNDPDGPLFQGDGAFPPFVIFDTVAQQNLSGEYPTREAAQIALAHVSVTPPTNYPTMLDAYHEIAAGIQARLFQADKGTPEYVDLCEQLASVAEECDEAELAGLLDEPARHHMAAAIVAQLPAWPTTQEGLDLMEAAQTETIERDLEFASYYARKAHTCSIDAVLALKVGRRDIAQQLRRMRDVYKHKARHLFNGVHYGNLFVPFGGL